MATTPDRATAIIDAHGMGSMTVGGKTWRIDARGEDAARAAIMTAVASYTKHVGHEVILSATDSEGVGHVRIHPSGKIERAEIPVLPPESITQTGPVAKPPARAGHALPRQISEPPAINTGIEEDSLEDIEHTVFVSRPPEVQSWRFAFSTGSVVNVWGSGFIGRQPAQDDAKPRDHIIAIDDKTKSVSRLHAEFGTHEGRLWVADQRSTNGTRVIRGSEVIECAPGQAVWVAPGNVVELGQQAFTVHLGGMVRKS